MHIRRDTKWLQLLISKCPCCDPLQVYVMPRGEGTSVEAIIGYFSITICIKDKNVQSIWAKKKNKSLSLGILIKMSLACWEISNIYRSRTRHVKSVSWMSECKCPI